MSEVNQNSDQSRENQLTKKQLEEKQPASEVSRVTEEENRNMTDNTEGAIHSEQTASQVKPSTEIQSIRDQSRNESISVFIRLINKYSEISNTQTYKWTVRVLWAVVILLVIMPAIGYVIFLFGARNLNSSVSQLGSTSSYLYSNPPTSAISKTYGQSLNSLSSTFFDSIALPPVTYVSQVSTIEETGQKSFVMSDTIKAAISMAILDSLRETQGGIEDYINREFDEWLNTLTSEKIDPFLEEYLNWFSIKLRNDLDLIKFVTGTSVRDIADRRITDFAEKFSQQVVSPEEIQKVANKITKGAFEHYIGKLTPLLSKVKVDYEVSDENWKIYLSQIAINLPQFEDIGTKVDFPNTTLADVLTLGGVALAAKLNPVIVKYGSVTFFKAIEKSLAALGVKAAAKLSTVAIAETFAKAVNPAIAVSLIVWDLSDASSQAGRERIDLRKNILEGLENLRQLLIYGDEDGGTGIVVLINKFQNDLRGGIINSLLDKI